MATKYVVRGMAEEGTCEHCGANCPKRRVYVQPVYADGDRGEVQAWGVICAGTVRSGSKSVRIQNQIVAEAKRADADREYAKRQKIARVVADNLSRDFGGGVVVVFQSAKDGANRLYRMTGRAIAGSYFAENAAGHIVRVDGSDADDVQFFAGLGFVQTTAAVAG